MIELKLTTNWHYSHHDTDGHDRNYLSFYLNDVLILKQKIPFDRNWEVGFDRRTSIYDLYLLNGRIYQKRQKYYGCSHPDNGKPKIREVSFPISKKRLEQFNIPKDLVINETI